MSKRSIWILVIGAIVLVAIGAAVVLALANPGGEPAPTSSPTASGTPAPSETPAPSPTPTPTPSETAAAATCENTSTAEFQAMMAGNGWISWETQDEQIGARPFDSFPGGAPVDQLICRWGESPDIPTDNLIDLAWAPLTGDETLAGQEALVEAGYAREESVEGAWLTIPGGDAYLFTGTDVRWAVTREDIAYIKAPGEEG
ncbi:hypothetical protein ABZ477_01090 [Microbacterium sp. NPDC019599]|uniref:hypothetical protein n=1 Tax=Microbacterium sp. NPDC019599 TaxID=3154690 RepID=UPI0033F81DF7